MRGVRLRSGLTVALVAFTVTVFPTTTHATTEAVLHSFGSGTDGSYPYTSLILDAAGNLYGTTYSGGTHANGTVFELSPKAGGGWTEKVLHSFNRSTGDGAGPFAGVILEAGNLYGTTVGGGAYANGTAFELTPKAGGGWKEKILHSFGNYKDGSNPQASLIFDSSGNLYGTTRIGGSATNCELGCGTVFELNAQ